MGWKRKAVRSVPRPDCGERHALPGVRLYRNGQWDAWKRTAGFYFQVGAMRFRVLVLLMAGCLMAQQPQASCSNCAVWNVPQKAFPIYGNTYYVGTHGLSLS